MSRFIVASLVIVVSLGVSLADEAANKKVLDALQGNWKADTLTIDGKNIPKPEGKELTLTFKGSEVTPSNNPKDVGTITIVDGSKKQVEFDLMEMSKKVSKGILVLDGDTLKLTMADPGKDRPTDFSKGMVMVLKREKK